MYLVGQTFLSVASPRARGALTPPSGLEDLPLPKASARPRPGESMLMKMKTLLCRRSSFFPKLWSRLSSLHMRRIHILVVQASKPALFLWHSRPRL